MQNDSDQDSITVFIEVDGGPGVHLWRDHPIYRAACGLDSPSMLFTRSEGRVTCGRCRKTLFCNPNQLWVDEEKGEADEDDAV